MDPQFPSSDQRKGLVRKRVPHRAHGFERDPRALSPVAPALPLVAWRKATRYHCCPANFSGPYCNLPNSRLWRIRMIGLDSRPHVDFGQGAATGRKEPAKVSRVYRVSAVHRCRDSGSGARGLLPDRLRLHRLLPHVRRHTAAGILQ